MTTKEQVLKLTYSGNGSPYCNVGSGNTNLDSLIFSKDGSPFWGHSGEVEPVTCSGNIKRILKVNWANVKTVSKAVGH